MPTSDGRPKRIHSMPIHTSEAVAAAIWVTSSAMPAPPPAPSAEPPLKPNQPTHSMLAPIIVSAGLCGGIWLCGKWRRLPTITAQTRAAVPAVAWTTMPPAKSITPQPAMMPPPQTQWVTGA